VRFLSFSFHLNTFVFFLHFPKSPPLFLHMGINVLPFPHQMTPFTFGVLGLFFHIDPRPCGLSPSSARLATAPHGQSKNGIAPTPAPFPLFIQVIAPHLRGLSLLKVTLPTAFSPPLFVFPSPLYDLPCSLDLQHGLKAFFHNLLTPLSPQEKKNLLLPYK